MLRLLTALLTLALTATGCSLMSTGDEPTASPASDTDTPSGTVVLVTHESFSLPKKLIRQFETTSLNSGLGPPRSPQKLPRSAS